MFSMHYYAIKSYPKLFFDNAFIMCGLHPILHESGGHKLEQVSLCLRRLSPGQEPQDLYDAQNTCNEQCASYDFNPHP